MSDLIDSTDSTLSFNPPAGPHETVLIGVDHGLNTVTKSQLGQYAPDVSFHRGLGNEQALGQFPVGQALSHQDQHLTLAVGQLGQCRPRAADRKTAI